MQANKTVNINGRLYDAVTGLPVSGSSAPKAAPATKPAEPAKTTAGRPTTAAHAVHATPQRSKTLNRRATKKPGVPKRPQPGKHMDIARSTGVTRFASHPVTTAPAKPATPAKPDAPAKTHPIAKRAAQRVTRKPAVVSAPARKPTPKQVKDAAIAKALATPAPTKEKSKKTKKRSFQWTRRFTIITALFVVLIGAGAVTYFNLPNLSVALAASQSGVDAKYPEYVPDGYSLSQPVTYQDGEVSLKFTSNTGNGDYTIVQENSSWDPSAVLENVVRKEAGDNYVLTQESGLKIYTYDGDAAWVSDEILYTIDSEAPLSNDQIRRIVTSL